MSVDNFIYDGIELRSKGFIVTHFNGGEDGEIDTDSQLSFNHLSMFRGKYQPFITSQYEDPLVMEWWIMKNPCIAIVDDETGEITYENLDNDDYDISRQEMSDLKRWLSRPTPHKLQLTSSDYTGVYWMGSFNVEEYIYGNNRIGAHLTFECNAPFGYYDDVVLSDELTANDPLTFTDVSDEIGFIYPDMEITVKSSGNLELTDRDGRKTIVKNCAADEVLTFSHLLTITSSDSEHKIGDDFNYVFYRISNTYNDRSNTLTSNLPIEYTITYKPIAKVVVV